KAEDGIRYWSVTGVQTCALPIWCRGPEGDRALLGPVEQHVAVASTVRRVGPGQRSFVARELHEVAHARSGDPQGRHRPEDDEQEIGRASCRERGSKAGGHGGCEE